MGVRGFRVFITNKRLFLIRKMFIQTQQCLAQFQDAVPIVEFREYMGQILNSFKHGISTFKHTLNMENNKIIGSE